MGRIVVVTGPPGAGKSVVSELLVRLLDPSGLVSGDVFFGFLRNGAIAPWVEEAHAQNDTVMEAAAAATGVLARHRDVVYDGVVGPWFLDTFRRAAGVPHLHYVMLLPSLEVCLERVSSRHGHGFTDLRAAEHMWWQLQRAGVTPPHLVPDGGEPPTEMASRIARLLDEDVVRYPWG